MVTVQDKGALIIQRASMNELAAELSKGLLDRPVVDMTGLTGRFDIRIDLAALTGTNQTDRMDASSALITAIREQLGLKLEARKGMAEVLVVDHAEKTPLEN